MRRTYVPPSGNQQAVLGLCGEQPGIQEARGRPPRPFIGPAGQGLDECLVMARIPRHGLYLTNVIKDLDKPLAAYININYNKQSWTISEEGWEYINELRDELKALPSLNCIVAIGAIPLVALCSRVGINKWHSSVIESTLVPGLKVVPTFHPATFIPPKFNFLNKPQIVEDLIKAKNEAKFREIQRTSRTTHIKPSFQQSSQYLNYCYEVGLRGQTIDIDIEVINKELDCIAFAWSPTEAICIPFRDKSGDYFTVEQEYEIMLLIGRILSEPRIAKRGANFIFDTQFLFHKYGIVPRGELHCTQIAQKIAFPDLSAGLDQVTRQWTDVPYYKEDGKKWMKMQGGSWEEWWNYNGMDVMVPNEAHPKQVQELIKQQNLETYERQRKLQYPLIYMAERGIRINVEGMIKYRDEQQIEIDKHIEKLHEEVGYELNPNSPQQIMGYFYQELGLKPYKKINTEGQYVDTSDVDALKRISRRGYKAAQMILDIRSLNKRISTYLNIGKVDKDGRYRSSYKPVGAETGRISSGETIFGTGGNQQNWPHDLLRFFLFDEGYIGYSIDLSQIENRIVAYVGGVLSQIKAFESGLDMHRLTASVIFNKPYDEISDEDGSSTLGDGRQSERFWGKKGNHATNYDVGYKTFALKNEMPEKDAKAVLEKIHRGYPQIRQGFHKIIQEMLFKDRFVTNLFNRKRLFLGPIMPSRTVPRNACFNTYREAYAQLPQSTTADKINEQGVNFIYYNQQWFKPVELLTQIHDSVVFQIPLTTPWVEHAEIILRIKQSLETPIYWHEREIKTPADLCIGLNMCKELMIELKSKEIPGTPELLADKLRGVYDALPNNR
uniref:Putative DNA polymerase n=1 Tax=viral metagenome TaxID=1070528 RepID=A0A6M3KG31_9ZZZZ